MKDTYMVTLIYARRSEHLEIKAASWREAKAAAIAEAESRLQAHDSIWSVLYDIICPDQGLVFGTVWRKVEVSGADTRLLLSKSMSQGV